MNKIDISTAIGNYKLPTCIYNASGAKCTEEEELDSLQQSESGAVLTKSCTVKKRNGNLSPRYVDLPNGSINSMGIPNRGYQFYLDYAKNYELSQSTKPLFVSVSGLCLEDNVKILTEFEGINCMIELNLSCPNVPGHPQIGYDYKKMDEYLRILTESTNRSFGVKLPPYLDDIHCTTVADILKRYKLDFITCCNSLGNGLVVDPGTQSTVIKPKQGFGGIGGDYMLPCALANVNKFYKLLDDTVPIIGCGGVKSGTDAFQHILCGASAVQVGTYLMKTDPGCFEYLNKELRLFMQTQGYSKLSDFRGKLKHI